MAAKRDRSKPHGHELPLYPSAAFGLFPTSKKKKLQRRSSDLFVSSKAPTAIPVRHPALQDALIQVQLDTRVRSIAYIASAVVASERVGAIAESW
jgi:hypothetical protein